MAARNALQESDARFNTLADALPHMVWSTLPDGFHDYFNARWYEFTGAPEGSTDGEGWTDRFHPEDREHARAIWRNSLRTGEPYEIEYRLRHRTGEYRWVLGRAMPMRGTDGTIFRWIGTCTDIDDSKRQSEQIEILSRELSHRIKNIFAVIGALIGLSARQNPQQKTFAKQLQQRIGALARAHEFVIAQSSGSKPDADNRITLQGLLHQILAPYPAYHEGRLRIFGEDVEVDDRSATPLALLIHELATNAAKYGALSNADGGVELHCQRGGSEFRLHWREQGGPEIRGEPPNEGFGTTLADLSIVRQLGGSMKREWLPAGLQVIVGIPSEKLRRENA